MALNDVMGNLNGLISSLPVDVSKNVSDVVLLLKAFGIAAIVYVIYVIAMGIFTYSRMKKVEKIEKKADAIIKKVDSIDKKLNKLLKKKR